MSKNNQGIILKLRESRTFKGVVLLVVINFLVEIFYPSISLALTEGPSQPEVQSFEPIGTNQMVDLFTGDFNYNIPLMNVPGPNGGYPINIAYNAGVSMDDEASWVGLGWNINPGALVRNKRGLPDEFSSEIKGKDWDGGDFIHTRSDMKESWTISTDYSLYLEIAGGNILDNSSLGASLRFNNYKGLSMSLSAGKPVSGPLSFDLSLDSDNGLGIEANINFLKEYDKKGVEYDLDISFNGSLSLKATSKKYLEVESRDDNGDRNEYSYVNKFAKGGSLTFARNNYSPSIGRDVNNYNLSFRISFNPVVIPITTAYAGLGISFSTQDYKYEERKGIKRPVMGYATTDSRNNNQYYSKDFVRQNDGQISKETAVLPVSYYAFDSYYSTGQGLSGFFRGRRNDVGAVHDVKLSTETFGASGSVETPSSVPLVHAGAGGSFQFGWDKQGLWNRSDVLSTTNEKSFAFEDPKKFGINETHYYKIHGEQTMKNSSSLDYVNSTDLALASFEPKSGLFTAKRRIINTTNDHISNNRDFGNSNREVRNTLVHSLKNNEVEGIGEFNINYYQYGGPGNYSSPIELDREHRKIYLDKIGPLEQEEVSIGHHDAGFKILNEEGAYYVYGLPAYNIKEVDNLFSVELNGAGSPEDINLVEVDESYDRVKYEIEGTHEFIDKKTISPYPHSYLLTSVQGSDYVDIANDGPTDDDLGHWVKFDYVQNAADYKWRTPYVGASYSDGQSYTREDDKGAYQYGEKELWYLGRIETKTHIAIFELIPRNDNLEAISEFANLIDLGSLNNGFRSGLLIDKIKLYNKHDYLTDPTIAEAIKTVHFEYDYSLCKGSPNSLSGGKGKLTLKKVWFTAQGSNRGEENPYIFDYTSVDLPPYLQHLNDGNNNLNYVNPNYNYNAYDSWGNFKPYEGLESNPVTTVGFGTHSNFPYVNQTRNGWEQSWMASTYNGPNATQFNRKITKEVNDLLASTWSLKKITLPSGGKINIEYETDDYSHVQHKVANQMFKIIKLGDFTDPNQLYTNGNESYSDNSSTDDEYRRRIYFKLENPIEKGLSLNDYAGIIYKDYVEPLMRDESGERNLYFKSKMRLTFNSNKEVFEYIRGYLPLESDLSKNEGGNDYFNFGVLQSPLVPNIEFIDGSDSYYSIGYVTIKPGLKKNGNYFNKYHPMALSAWTYMQSSAPELLNPASIQNSNAPQNAGDIASMFTNIINVIPQTASSFGFIRKYCKNRNFAQTIDLENSGIRLASPDKIKFGGGHRVKTISITDNWNAHTSTEVSRTYGQHYDYTIMENGEKISSGVAQYEPQAGGDENALKYPVHFYGKNKLFTNNNLFTEMPLNEALFPGAQVGYRKVSVTSLNTKEQVDNKSQGSPSRGRTSGVTVHEFYTAKDFPTIVDYSVLSEENNTKSTFNLPIWVPLVGSLKRNFYHGSQAFKIELNDMHGKQKSVKTYESDDYEIGENPITESTFSYQSKPIVYQDENVQKLVNEVDFISSDNSNLAIGTSKKLMGVDVDLFTDQRENKSFWSQTGLDFNTDVVPPIPLPSLWPTFSNHKTLFRTFVTNKVINRTGILKKSVVRDMQTVNESEIIAYDEESGIPILTRVKNEFGDNFYKYDIPAYYKYDRMSHAYKNIDYTVPVGFVSFGNTSSDGVILRFSKYKAPYQDVFDHLVRGDEVLFKGFLTEVLIGRTLKEHQLNPKDNADIKKGYYLGAEYDELGNQVGILHFPYGLNTNINNSNYDGLTYDNNGVIKDVPTNIQDLAPIIKVIRSGRRNHYSQIASSYTTKGLISSNSQMSIGSGGHIVQTDIIDDVLTASASLFKDDWLLRDNNLSWDGVVENPFLTGNSGIWRPYKTYSYAGERNTQHNFTNDNSTSNPKLREDGVMDNVPMFTWDIGNIEDYISDWEWASEITRFSPDAYEIENENRLGIKSSALYGYDNSLAIGIGGNADVRELGVYDFELSLDLSMTFEKQLTQTNMNFDNSNHSSLSLFNINQFNVKKATIDGANTIRVITNIPFNQFNISDYENNIGLSLTSEKGVFKGNEGFYFNGNLTGVVADENGLAAIYVKPYVDNLNTFNSLLENSQYHGKVSFLSKSNLSNTTTNVVYSNDMAHTGKHSMKVISSSVFDQPRLKLIPEKRYILSLWVARENTNTKTYETNNLIKLGSMVNGSLVQNLAIHDIFYSKIIEGWQKVDIEFSSNQVNSVLGIEFTPGSTGLFVDDIRFSPKTGGIKTFVYDSQNFRLIAELNADNYATLYFYDELGNLTLKKQETEEGIFTITESRGHASEN